MAVLDWLPFFGTGRATQVVTQVVSDVVTDVRDEVRDAGHAAAYVRHWFRGNRPTPTAPISALRSQRPALLVQGYFANRGSLHLLAERLARRGHGISSLALGPVHVAGIRKTAVRLAHEVETICERAGVEQLDVIGHSLGGLAGLDYIKHLGGAKRVRRLILLGAPLAGTWTALAGLVTAPFGRASLELLPSSQILNELRTTPIPSGVDVVNVVGVRDFLAPPSASPLSGARRVTVAASHAGLLVDETVAQALSKLLSDAPGKDTAA